MRRQIVELQRLDMGERPGGLEAGNARDCRVRTEVEENLVARQHARAAVIEAHLKRFRRHKAPGPHDQFGAACLVVCICSAISRSTMSRLRWRTFAMSVVTGPLIIVPNWAA